MPKSLSGCALQNSIIKMYLLDFTFLIVLTVLLSLIVLTALIELTVFMDVVFLGRHRE